MFFSENLGIWSSKYEIFPHEIYMEIYDCTRGASKNHIELLVPGQIRDRIRDPVQILV